MVLPVTCACEAKGQGGNPRPFDPNAQPGHTAYRSDTQSHTKQEKPDESAARATTSDASLLSKDKCSEGNDA